MDFIFSKWPEAIWAERRVHVPLVVACQSDMGPAERRDVPGDIVWDGHAAFPQIIHRGFQIFRIPQDDGCDQKVETGCFVDLMLITAIAHFSELVEEDPACEGVSGFSSGQTCACSFSQIGYPLRSRDVNMLGWRTRHPIPKAGSTTRAP